MKICSNVTAERLLHDTRLLQCSIIPQLIYYSSTHAFEPLFVVARSEMLPIFGVSFVSSKEGENGAKQVKYVTYTHRCRWMLFVFCTTYNYSMASYIVKSGG